MNITSQQARQRFTIIPEPLRDAMFSLQAAEIMDGIMQQYHLDDAKADVVGKIVGWVFLGFIHPEDVTREIQTQLNLPSQAASDISKSIDAKIFAALRDDLNKAYAPVPEEEKINEPEIISAAVAATVAIPAPKIISEAFVATPKFAAGTPPPALNRDITAPKPLPQAAPAPAPQPPKPSNAAGWSKATSQQPVVKLGTITSGVPKPQQTPTSATSSTTAPKTISMPTGPGAKPAGGRSMSEFERLDLSKKGLAPSTPTPPIPRQVAPGPAPKPAAAPAPKPSMTTAPSTPAAAPAIPPQPAPVMLHQVSSFAPIETSSSSFNTKKPAQDQLRGTTAQGSMPSRPAVVEFGNAAGVPSGSAPKSATPAPSTPSTPPPSPMANTGPRQMTEIQAPATAPAPMPSSAFVPMPATPPQPPMPPASSNSQKDKVIVKDFL